MIEVIGILIVLKTIEAVTSWNGMVCISGCM